jgi:hypothetical protein
MISFSMSEPERRTSVHRQPFDWERYFPRLPLKIKILYQVRLVNAHTLWDSE